MNLDNGRSLTPVKPLSQKSSERYSPNFKKKVLNSLKDPDNDNKSVSIAEASKKFQIHKTTISDWIKEEKRQDELRLIADNSTINKETDHETETINESNHGEETAETEFINWLKSKRTSSDCLPIEQGDVVDQIELILQKWNKGQNCSSTSSDNSYLWLFELYKKIKLCIKEKLESNEGEESSEKNTKDKNVQLSKKTKYSSQFKLEVAEFGKKFGQRSSSRLFAISQRRMFDWIRSYETLIKKTSEELETRKRNLSPSVEQSASKTSRGTISLWSSKQLADFDVETAVFDWVEDQLPSKPSSAQIRKKALQLYREKGIETIQCSYGWYRRWCERFKKISQQRAEEDNPIITWVLTQYDNNVPVSYLDLQNYSREQLNEKKPDFRASIGWATRFVKRHHLLINWEGFCDFDFPPNLAKDVEKFLNSDQFSKDCNLERIGAIDEIPLNFSFPTSSQSDKKDTPDKISRKRKITIKNCHATLILGILANGELLTPMIIVKAEGEKNLNQLFIKNENPVVVYYAKTTEPTIMCLEKWLELIWVKCVGAGESFLFMDSYDLHHLMKEKCEKFDIKQKVFPPGCSAKLQPLNVYARRAFLKLVEDKWIAHIKDKDEKQMKLPITNDLVDWVHSAFIEINNQKSKLKESFNQVKLISI